MEPEAHSGGMKTIVVFGAGPGLGMAAARRFGREGFRVALVSRNKAMLDAHAAELAQLGIESVVFAADLKDRKRAVEIIEQIEAHIGSVDVFLYGPHGSSIRCSSVQKLDLDDLDEMLDVKFRTAVALVQAILPGMIKRGDGALFFTLGPGQRHSDPDTATLNIADAATYHYALSLSESLASDPVYVGTLLIGALIAGSHNADLVAAGKLDYLPSEVLDRPYTTVSADTLAEQLWDMYIKRDRFEEFIAG